VNRNAWRLVLVTLALFLLWVSEREERQGMDVVCQASVVPGYSASMQAPALRDATLDHDCESGASASGPLMWEPSLRTDDVARRLAEYLSPSK